MFGHSVLGFCMWDIPALLVLVLMIAVYAVHRHNQKKREKEFAEELEEMTGQEVPQA